MEKRPRERVIPPDSRLISGPGDCAIYLYERAYKNRKGQAKSSFWAKAFRNGEIRSAWHRCWTNKISRAKDIAAFLEEEEAKVASLTAEADDQISEADPGANQSRGSAGLT